VSEKSLEMRHLQAFAHLEEPGVAPSWAESLGMEEMRKTAPMEAVGSIIAAGQEAKEQILV
jgi:hypothetical protein